jgi:hypothetical protein
VSEKTSNLNPERAGGRGFLNDGVRSYLWFLGLLISVLLVLFHQALEPGKVQFSNDAPLGVYKSDWLAVPGGIKALWYDLNYLGSNQGVCSGVISGLLRILTGPVWYSKIFPSFTLLFLGSGAWLFFRCLKFSPAVCAIGGLAAALSSGFFSAACWGVGTQEVAIGNIFLALAAIVSGDIRHRWIKLALGGFAVGMAIMEGLDMGAIFSLVVAAFVMFHSLMTGVTAGSLTRGILRTAMIAICAAILSSLALSALVGSQIKGIAGTGQDAETKARRWNFSTQWSLPKKETLSLIVPGVFGYRLDTPEGGSYWGSSGQDATWEEYFKNGRQGQPGQGFMRHSGGGNYLGVLVALVALWGALQSLRNRDQVFTPAERKLVWFFSAIAVIALLLAFGRHAPFYQFFYALPYSSTIRNPTKFLQVLSFTVVVLFAFGLQGLYRRYLKAPLIESAGFGSRFKNWRTKGSSFDRFWFAGSLLAIGVAVIGWVLYASSRTKLVAYLTDLFSLEHRPDDAADLAQSVATFSIGQAGWFVVLLIVSIAVLTIIMTGAFAGRRAKVALVLIGLIVVGDLARANSAWILFWNYKQKYEVNGPNPIIKLLKDKPYEHRVVILPNWILDAFQISQQGRQADGQLRGLYEAEWKQQLFPYYNIQTLDIVQMPRTPEDIEAFERALAVRSGETLHNLVRRLELTNTRYVLAMAGFLDLLNNQFDAGQGRFRIAERFNIVSKPGVARPTHYEELTAEVSTNGVYALIEFTGALPRAKLYSHWQVSTNDETTLKELASPTFNPAQSVFVAGTMEPGTNGPADAGTVEFSHYEPKDLQLRADAKAPAILLLNDRYDSNWRVLVDGKPSELLRCNFIMRGVSVPAGSHTVEFVFKPAAVPFYISFAAIGLGLLLIGYLVSLAPVELPGGTPKTK